MRGIKTFFFFVLIAIETGFPKAIGAAEPILPAEFRLTRITDSWEKYSTILSFGRGQTLALVDDGCKLSMPEWNTKDEGRPKVLVSYDSVDGDNDPKHEGKGYHGSTIGIPSSVNHAGKHGVAFNNQLAIVRSLVELHGGAVSAGIRNGFRQPSVSSSRISESPCHSLTRAACPPGWPSAASPSRHSRPPLPPHLLPG